MLKEEYQQQLLKDLYEKDTLDVYDYTALTFSANADVFPNTKPWADKLVKEKLAKYTDQEHLILQITNYGRYWMMNGGYTAFLQAGRNGQEDKKSYKQKEIEMHKEKEELVEARLRLTHYRLVAFWLTIVISSIGFLLSLYNLYLFMKGKK